MGFSSRARSIKRTCRHDTGMYPKTNYIYIYAIRGRTKVSFPIAQLRSRREENEQLVRKTAQALKKSEAPHSVPGQWMTPPLLYPQLLPTQPLCLQFTSNQIRKDI